MSVSAILESSSPSPSILSLPFLRRTPTGLHKIGVKTLRKDNVFLESALPGSSRQEVSVVGWSQDSSQTCLYLVTYLLTGLPRGSPALSSQEFSSGLLKALRCW